MEMIAEFAVLVIVQDKKLMMKHNIQIVDYVRNVGVYSHVPIKRVEMI